MPASSIPPEIWLEIFKNTDYGDPGRLALVNRSFCDLARVLLFQRISFVPYWTDHDDRAYPLAFAADKIARHKQRIEFLLRPEIQPLVQSINIMLGPVWIG
jgi:hypothetical protein